MELYVPAREEELEPLLALMRAELHEHLEAGLRIAGLTEGQFGRLFRTRGHVVRIECEGRDAGFYWTELRGRVLHVHALLLRPEFRGRGIARRLLERLEADHAGRADFLELGVHRSNVRARRLYERVGFTVSAESADLGFAIMRRPLGPVELPAPPGPRGEGVVMEGSDRSGPAGNRPAEGTGEIRRIIEELRRAHDGDAWHGSSLREVLAGVDAAAAAAHPVPGAHSIWEIVLHLSGWAREVARRVEGGTPGLPADGDWPQVAAAGEAEWQAALADLQLAHAELVEAVGRRSEAALDEPVGRDRDAPTGTGVTWHIMLHGVAQHDAYHGGQIALLRKEVEQGYHARFAARTFNRVWELMEKADRTGAEADEMLHAAHASRYHWGFVGEPVNLARGEWQVSRMYTVLGRGEPALRHARTCLDIVERHGIGDFDLAFAYEAMARATALAGDLDAARGWRDKAAVAGEAIAEEEDRKLFLSDLATLPES